MCRRLGGMPLNSDLEALSELAESILLLDAQEVHRVLIKSTSLMSILNYGRRKSSAVQKLLVKIVISTLAFSSGGASLFSFVKSNISLLGNKLGVPRSPCDDYPTNFVSVAQSGDFIF